MWLACYTNASHASQTPMLLSDIMPGQTDSYPSSFHKISRDSSTTYFTAQIGSGKRGIFITDGTVVGTKQCTSGQGSTMWIDEHFTPIRAGGKLIFSDGHGFYVLSGRVADASSEPKRITAPASYMQGMSTYDAVKHGHVAVIGPYMYVFTSGKDGDALVSFTMPSMAKRDTVIENMRGRVLGSLGNKIIIHGKRTDGNRRGRTPFAMWSYDTVTGQLRNMGDLDVASSQIWEISVCEGIMFFSASQNHQRDLWSTDGTYAGTVRVTNFGRTVAQEPFLRMSFRYWLDQPDDAFRGFAAQPPVLGPLFDKITRGPLFFNVNGTLYANSNGRLQGTQAVKFLDSSPAPVGAVREGMVVGNLFLFTAFADSAGRELWASDGKSAWLVKDILPGVGSSNPIFHGVIRRSTDGGGYLIFSIHANDDTGHMGGFWITDGTARSTVQLLSETENTGPIDPRIIVLSDRAYFRVQRRTFVVVVSPGSPAGYELHSSQLEFTSQHIRPPFRPSYTTDDAVILRNDDEDLIVMQHKRFSTDAVGAEPYVQSFV